MSEITFSGTSLAGSLFAPGVDGSITLSAERFWPRHRHDEWEINLVERGRARYLLADRGYDLHPGTLVWLAPGQYHTLVDASTDYHQWVVCCRPSLIETAQRGDVVALPESGESCRSLNPAEARVLSDLFHQVAQIPTESETLFYAGLTYAFATAQNVFHRATNPDGRIFHSAVRKTVALLRQPESDIPGVDALASRVGVSTSRLSRLFRQQTGLTLPEFRNQERLRRFHSLMTADPVPSLLSAAINAGFGSYAHFYRIFRQATGTSPREIYSLR